MRRVFFLLLFAANACAKEPATWEEYAASFPPLRTLSHETEHTLRVLYLEDPRLPAPAKREREKLYRKIEVLLNAWYSYKVKVKEVGSENVLERFKKDSAVFETERAKDFLRQNRIDLGALGAKDSILQAIQTDIKRREESQIRRYVKLRPGASKADAVKAVYAVFENRLTRLRNIRAGKEGETLHNRRWADTQSYPHWEIFLSELREADFVLTNTVIAGPDALMPLYVAVRGGITNGFVTNSAHNPYQAVGVVAMLPFLSDAPFFIKERGKLSGELDILATFWMHELGHFFLRMKEHYGEAGCVHVAPVGLQLSDWHQAIRKSSNRCRNLPEESLLLY